ncbi:MAG: hypothetical protein LBL07_08995, partial [Tannerella sp.]|nr:hypothetical protein [Tannerella sp.]
MNTCSHKANHSLGQAESPDPGAQPRGNGTADQFPGVSATPLPHHISNLRTYGRQSPDAPESHCLLSVRSRKFREATVCCQSVPGSSGKPLSAVSLFPEVPG